MDFYPVTLGREGKQYEQDNYGNKKKMMLSEGKTFLWLSVFLTGKVDLKLWGNLPQIENNKILFSTQLVRMMPVCVYW